MDQWIPAQDFIAADVIRWTEGDFEKRRRGKSLCIGERQVVAEVLERGEDEWVRLLVRACTVTRDDYAGKHVEILKPETPIRRGLKKILRGKPERLLWDDESARAEVIGGRAARSKFGDIPTEE